MCSGEAFFQRAKSSGLRFSSWPVEVVAGAGQLVLNAAVRELAVALAFGVVLGHVEIHRAVDFVGQAVGDDFLDHLNLLDDVAAGLGLDVGRQAAQAQHVLAVAVGEVLGHLHGLDAGGAGGFFHLVFAGVGVAFQVAHVGDVAHVAHLVAAGGAGSA